MIPIIALPVLILNRLYQNGMSFVMYILTNRLMMQRIVFVICFSLMLPVFVAAQDDDKGESSCPAPENKEALKLMEKAKDRKKYDFNQRQKHLADALALEPDWAEANLMMANMIMKKAVADGLGDNYPGAKKFLKSAIEACPEGGAEPYYLLGKQYYIEEKYAEAIPYLDKYVNYETDDAKKLGKDYEFNAAQASEMLSWSKFYVDVKKNPKPFNPSPVPGISTERDEYLAIITPDNTMALFIRRVPMNQMDRVWQSQGVVELFSSSNRQSNGQFEKGGALPAPFNKNPNEGGPTMTIDNKHLYYTISKEGTSGMNTDIYTTDYGDGQWTEIRSLGDKVNDPIWWDSQPSISADGRHLYFASNRPGGQGGIDIYVTHKQPDGSWSIPVNLGPKINSAGDEKSPFIHSDSQTLYFSSNGHPSVGGYDIFYARADEKGNWKTPVNIGIPINTEGDDIGFFVSTDGATGFFCSNTSLPGQVGGYDVYQFDLYKEARPEKVVILTGNIQNKEGAVSTGPAEVQVTNVRTKEQTSGVVDTANGSFAVAIKLKEPDDYVVTLKKDGAAFNSQLITNTAQITATKVTTKPLEVQPVEVGGQYTINDINFASNSAVIEPSSLIVLEQFAQYLKDNPNMKIEIRGHTDNVGDDNRNMDLSNERAFAVFEILTSKYGVPRAQISGAKGYGETKPIADNNTEAGRTKNRRTEFVITEK